MLTISLATPPLVRRVAALAMAMAAGAFTAGAADFPPNVSGTQGGASATWIFANLSFTGMRAQDKGTTFWKVVTFIFGFPGTLLTLMVVERGSQRAYGIDMPRK